MKMNFNLLTDWFRAWTNRIEDKMSGRFRTFARRLMIVEIFRTPIIVIWIMVDDIVAICYRAILIGRWISDFWATWGIVHVAHATAAAAVVKFVFGIRFVIEFSWGFWASCFIVAGWCVCFVGSASHEEEKLGKKTQDVCENGDVVYVSRGTVRNVPINPSETVNMFAYKYWMYECAFG